MSNEPYTLQLTQRHMARASGLFSTTDCDQSNLLLARYLPIRTPSTRIKHEMDRVTRSRIWAFDNFHDARSFMRSSVFIIYTAVVHNITLHFATLGTLHAKSKNSQ